MNLHNPVPAETVDIKKEGLKFGLLNGTIAVLLLVIPYYIGLETFVKVSFIQRFIPYMMIILVIGGLNIRRRQGGYLSFKEGLQFGFVSYIISGLMSAITIYILYNVVDPELTKTTFEYGVQATIEKMKAMGSPQEDITKMVEDARKNANQTGFREVFLGYGYELIFGFLSALIVSVVIKKDRPAEA